MRVEAVKVLGYIGGEAKEALPYLEVISNNDKVKIHRITSYNVCYTKLLRSEYKHFHQ